jgi:Flp pilus assembly protein TadG
MKKRSRSNCRGNAIVELALSAPLFLLIFSTCFQYGYYFYIYNRLEDAVRAGARYASLRAYNSATSTPTDDFTAAVQDMVVYGSPASGSQAVVPGLAPGNVNLSVGMINGVPSQMTVFISGYKINGVFGTWTLSAKPVAVFPYEGRLANGNG